MKNKLKNCGNSKYKGIKPPKCNKGLGCDFCRKVWLSKHITKDN